MDRHWRTWGLAALAVALVLPGCVNLRGRLFSRCSEDCNSDCEDDDDGCKSDHCRRGLGGLGGGSGAWLGMMGCGYRRSNAIPETLPLGSTVQSHYQVMETNGEAMDFVMYQHEFLGETAQLTPDGKDHILEIAARMRSVPFPIVVERTWNNADPELDGLRRNLVALILTDLGNPDAEQRTVVATSYGPGYGSIQAEPMYYRHVSPNGGFGGGYGTYGNNFGTYGGFGGGVGGGVGFGP